MESHGMQWLIDRAEAVRSEIKRDKFFDGLQSVQSVVYLAHYFVQLAYFSPMFISALLARAAGEHRGSPLANAWRDHAAQEADHPAQFQRWISAHGFPLFGKPTTETVELGALCWWSATRESDAQRVIRLNLAAEGVALDVFSATLVTLERLGIDPGPGSFWRAHRKVDADHMLIGLDLIEPATPRSPLGVEYASTLDHTLDMFRRMLGSW